MSKGKDIYELIEVLANISTILFIILLLIITISKL